MQVRVAASWNRLRQRKRKASSSHYPGIALMLWECSQPQRFLLVVSLFVWECLFVPDLCNVYILLCSFSFVEIQICSTFVYLQIHFNRESLFHKKHPKNICGYGALPYHGYHQALQLRLKDLGHEDGSRARRDPLDQREKSRPTTSLQLECCPLFECCWISADVFFDCVMLHFEILTMIGWKGCMAGQPPQSWKESPCKVETWRRCKSSSKGLWKWASS